MTNVYNGAGTRVSSTVTGGNTQLDLRTDIGQTDALLQSDNSSVSDVNYVPGIAERRGSTWTYDHSGIKNIDSQTNGSQTVSSTRTYDAYGAVVASSGSHAGPFGYGGKFGYQEDTAGYKLLGDRWYDPEAGRFLTRDKAHDGRNWYVYCDNNPLVKEDRRGANPLVVIIGFAAVAIGAYTLNKWGQERTKDFDRERAKKLADWRKVNENDDGPSTEDSIRQSNRIKAGVEAQRQIALEKMRELYLADPLKKVGGAVGGAILGPRLGLPTDEASQLLEDSYSIGESAWEHMRAKE